MAEISTVPAPRFDIDAERALANARHFAEVMAKRRTVRDFSDEPVDLDVISACVEAAATAPSGANVQPWRFVVVTDRKVKKRIRLAAEAEEREFYDRRASDEWLKALAPLGTDDSKPFLDTAPVLIAVFEVHKGPTEPRPYYVKESVGIAVGFLLAALHQAGLATLTHTPSPMKFLGELCGRPHNERPFVLIPVGYPAPGAQVPAITRKPVSEVMVTL
ncbi:nitroreductase family protein [Stackebrandtia nassauensis]|uniref:Nitroreductase n=1 Tax=Stackebrandtia nassauensis (strain DSM 44728 / CIP 108903 / NRRL B-16338 / NBRC 102104 / LLR-40K-21) TaxID=446470 RepID=D3Q7T2_STANL|nr:nitroreductase family protein [Stackebrandtia nassauensis]ADD44424.1 nitroreductase [Stackebrandtia nassauensis DSM 44728]